MSFPCFFPQEVNIKPYPAFFPNISQVNIPERTELLPRRQSSGSRLEPGDVEMSGRVAFLRQSTPKPCCNPVAVFENKVYHPTYCLLLVILSDDWVWSMHVIWRSHLSKPCFSWGFPCNVCKVLVIMLKPSIRVAICRGASGIASFINKLTFSPLSCFIDVLLLIQVFNLGPVHHQ